MKIFLLIVTTLSTLSCLAQKTYRFETLSINEGLSQSGVTCLTQDQLGYLWVGTQDGLNRYDGHAFKIYRNKKRDPASIIKNYISSLLVDGEGNIWVATLGYLSKYNPTTDNFSNYKIAIKDVEVNPELYIWNLSEYSTGIIALSTNEGFFHFDILRNQFYVQAAFTKTIGKPVITFFRTKTMGDFVFGNTFIIQKQTATSDWMYAPAQVTRAYYLPNQDEVYAHYKTTIMKYVSPGNWAVQKQVKYWSTYFQMLETGHGEIWLAGAENISIYSKYGKLLDVIPSFEIVASAENPITALYETRDGVVWIGTSGYGLKKYNPRSNQFGYLGTSTTGSIRLQQNYVDAIYTSNDTVIYVATPDAIEILDLYEKTSTHLSGPGRIRHIIADDDNTLWFLSVDECWVLKDGRFLKSGLLQNKKLKIYPKTKRGFVSGGRIKLFDHGKWQFLLDKVSEADVQELQVFGDTVWVGFGPTAASPLALYQFHSKKLIKEFINEPNNENAIHATAGIKYIFRDSKKRTWIGTGGNGLFRYYPSDNKFVNYTEEDGLPNNVVYGILEDDDHNLWLSTNKGLCKFNPDTKQIQNFDVFDGLQSDEFNTGAFFKSKSGRLYFGGINGVSYFDPKTISVDNTVSKAIISGYYVNGKQLADYSDFIRKSDSTSYLSLRYSERDFGFDFISIGFSFPARVRYRYVLENYDNQWHDIGDLQHINFTNIQPGRYVFRVKASDSFGNWQTEATALPILIDAPVWRKPWVWIIVSLIPLMVLPGFYYAHISTLRKRAVQLERIVADRTHEIQLQNKEIAFQNATLLEQAAMLKEKNQELERTKDMLELEVKYFHQQNLLKTSIETLDEERKRISQDLHDELGAVLSITRMHIVRVRDLYAKGIVNLEPNLQEVFKLTEAALATMRRISHELMPPMLNEFGLIKTMESTARQINEANKLTAVIETPDASLRWPMTVELNLYRICMELINNTLKHAQASRIQIYLKQEDESLLLIYTDNGIGLQNIKRDGRGLRNIEMRVTTMGGILKVMENEIAGFHASISIPASILLQTD